VRSQKVLFAAIGAVTVMALVSFALVSLGATNNEVFPTSLNSDPGGTMALYQVLEREGVPVERLFTKPRKDDSQIGAVLYFSNQPNWSYFEIESIFSEADYPEGVVIIYAETGSPLVKRADYVTQEVRGLVPAMEGITRTGTLTVPADRDRSSILETADGRAIVVVEKFGVRTIVEIRNGYAYLNRFLGRDDNAALIVSVIKSVLPEGKKLVLPEYAYGVGATDNLFTRLGPSYSAALIQLALMFILAIYTLGKRFGYPDYDAPIKPGSRHFVQALGDAFRRGKSTDIVIETEVRRAMRIAGRKLSLPAGMTDEEKLVRIPGELGSVMRILRDWQGKKVGERETREMLQRLDQLLSEIGRQRWG
jgi:hypothetical protein